MVGIGTVQPALAGLAMGVTPRINGLDKYALGHSCACEIACGFKWSSTHQNLGNECGVSKKAVSHESLKPNMPSSLQAKPLKQKLRT